MCAIVCRRPKTVIFFEASNIPKMKINAVDVSNVGFEDSRDIDLKC